MQLRPIGALATFVVALGGVGAGKSRSQASGGTPSGAASGADASASAALASSRPPLDAGRDAGVGERSLLKTADARIAVSSLVRSPNASPNDLVSGPAITAWNGKTGDLVGGWIAFRVPKESTVRTVLLTAGFDRVEPDGRDLFTMKHRITRLRIFRDGAALRDVDLDPNVRAVQRISIDAPGGDYRLEVLATLPGTNAAWRELAVG